MLARIFGRNMGAREPRDVLAKKIARVRALENADVNFLHRSVLKKTSSKNIAIHKLAVADLFACDPKVRRA